MKAKMPTDATLRSVSGGLADPENFVRRLMGSMDNWDVIVTLDVCSNPKRPSYYLDEVMERDEAGAPLGTMPWGWYDGHHRFSEDAPHLSALSTQAMTKHEVQCLLADLLGKPHPVQRR